MNRHLTFLTLIAILSCCMPALAQQHPNRMKEDKLKYVVGTEVNLTDSVNAYKLLYENIPQDIDFLNDPIFAIIGRKRYFYFSVGANLKLGLCYDRGRVSTTTVRTNVFSTVVYSIIRNYVDPYGNSSFGIDYADQLKYGQYALANVMWRLNRLLLVGAEYVYG